MQTLKNSLVILILTLCFVSCKDNQEPEIKTVGISEVSNDNIEMDPNAKYAKAEFGIEGMTCAMGCAKTIEKKLAKMDGVKSAKVDFDSRIAMVEYNEALVSPNSLEEAVARAGDVYSVKGMILVNEFTSEKACSMACCNGKTDEEKANCQMDCCSKESTMHTEEGKTLCAEDCQKACCAEKA